MGDKALVNTGAQIFIGTQAASATGDTFTEILEVTSIGEFGAEAPVIDATALGDSKRAKRKGIADEGELALSGHHAPTDAGQAALAAAADNNSQTPFNFRVVYPDTPVGGGTPTKYEFKAFVTSFKRATGDVDGIISFTSNLAITGDSTETIAAAS
jgi:hypothetical protein